MSEQSTPHVSKEIMAKFMAKVQQGSGKDSCWNWTGPKYKNHGNIPSFSYSEYGRKKNQSARAFIHVRTTGETQKPHSVVYRAKCNNPLCVKPSHIIVESMASHLTRIKDKYNQSQLEKIPVVNPTKTIPVTTTTTTVLAKEPSPKIVKAQQLVAEYKNKNPLAFLAGPIKEAIEKQKARIEITKDLVTELEKELRLFEVELNRVEKHT